MIKNLKKIDSANTQLHSRARGEARRAWQLPNIIAKILEKD